MGDVLKVWALQSFFGGGFLKGEVGIVFQDQHTNDGSVLVTIKRNIKGKHMLDKSYEVYPEQTKLIQHATSETKQSMKDFKKLQQDIRTHEHNQQMAGKRETHLGYAYAPEFYIDSETFTIKLDKEALEYPEAFI